MEAFSWSTGEGLQADCLCSAEANEGEKLLASLTYVTAHVEANTTIAYEHQ